MDAIIHIGMEKTGSTSIQGWKALNELALREQGVVQMKQTGMIGPDMQLHRCASWVAHKEIGYSKKSAFARIAAEQARKLPAIHEQASNELENLSAQDGVFLGSCEHLFSMSAEQIEGLETFLARYFGKVTYVVYMREPVEWYASLYSQVLRAGHTTTFSEYSERADGVQKRISRWKTNLQLWSQTEGDLQVRLLERDTLKNGDLYDDFAEIVGVTGAFDSPERMNEAIGADFVNYAVEINKVFAGRPPLPRNHHQRGRVMRHLSDFSRNAPKLKIGNTQAKAIYSEIDGILEDIRGEYFPERENLFVDRDHGDGVAATELTSDLRTEIDQKLAEQLLLDIWSAP
ncbi:hypothetical protein BXY66_0569 [Shimia isoporae]|uniref:Uncharacterized protein n=1 Tax=Shimia isoporae TaxID=647720 RepID=A0A4R1NU33_9RHOB|nr:hypothetical protein [Shimia isoporae]TCL08532.1 hypothetical protein BXY66_0569 [Shimia isoporae]